MCSVCQNNAIDVTWQLMLTGALRQAAQPNTHVWGTQCYACGARLREDLPVVVV